MYVKIMSDENIPDSDKRKSFRLLGGVTAIVFNRAPEAPQPSDIPHAYISFEDGELASFDLHGNVYVMDDSGKTIEKFCVAPVSESEYPAKA